MDSTPTPIRVDLTDITAIQTLDGTWYELSPGGSYPSVTPGLEFRDPETDQVVTVAVPSIMFIVGGDNEDSEPFTLTVPLSSVMAIRED